MTPPDDISAEFKHSSANGEKILPGKIMEVGRSLVKRLNRPRNRQFGLAIKQGAVIVQNANDLFRRQRTTEAYFSMQSASIAFFARLR